MSVPERRDPRMRLARNARLFAILPPEARIQLLGQQETPNPVEDFRKRLTEFVQGQDRYRRLPTTYRIAAITVAAETLAAPEEAILNEAMKVERISKEDPFSRFVTPTDLARSRYSFYLDSIEEKIRGGATQEQAKYDALIELRTSLVVKRMREVLKPGQGIDAVLGKHEQASIALAVNGISHVTNSAFREADRV